MRKLSSHDTGLRVHFTDLPTQARAAGTRINFTFPWLEADRWEQGAFERQVAGSPPPVLPAPTTSEEDIEAIVVDRQRREESGK